MTHEDIWNSFCSRQKVVDQAVPLFETSDELTVNTHEVGRVDKRKILSRSKSMESLIIEQTDLLTADIDNITHQYDGLIYMMFFIEGGLAKPLYIGKTESKGRSNRLSVNIKNLRSDKSKFARWGNGYKYHIGDLSAVAVPGHHIIKQSNKYVDWANTLFVEYPSNNPELKQQTYFWCKAWDRNSDGIWENFGKTRLTFLEYLMIGVASSAFPTLLLNREGQSRA